MAKNMINAMNDIIDEFLLNKDFYSLDMNRRKFSDCYMSKVTSLLQDLNLNENEKKKNQVMSKFHEKFIVEEGTATKKLKLFLDEKNAPFIESGLKCNESAKGPIRRVLKFSLEGDDNCGIWNQDV